VKKYALQSILFTRLFFFNLVSANYDKIEFIEFANNEVSIPEKLGNIKLYKDVYGFHVLKDGEIYDVKNCFCDPLLRKMSNEQLVNFLGRNKPKIIFLTPEEFSQISPDNMVEISEPEMKELLGQLLSSGYISINQMDGGEYILHAKIRILGGVGDEGSDILKAGAAAAGVGAIGTIALAGGTGSVVGAGLAAGVIGTEAVAGVGAAGVLGGALTGAVELAGAVLGGPVTIVACIGFLGYVAIRLLTRSPETPTANPPANPPALVATPDEENPAPQATPVSPVVYEKIL